jgi:hypothetical protein
MDLDKWRFVVSRVEAVHSPEPAMFEVRLTIEDSSEIVLVMDGAVLCSLADSVSQYATP